MYAICLRYTGNSDEAKDLLHDGFIKLFDRISGFREFPRFEAWMHRLFTNHCIDYVRSAYKRYMRYHNDDHLLTIPEADKEEETEMIFTWSSDEIIAALSQLRPDHRSIINMYAIEGFSHQEIAQKLGIEYSSSRSKLLRARQSLKQILQAGKKNG